MKSITREMLKIYKPVSGLDWLNYKLIKENATYHHIVKKEVGGQALISNGSILMPVGHQYLHIIEYKEVKTYMMLNKIFEIVNRQGHEPTREQREIIEYLLQEFEYIHRDDVNSKGKPLIKYKYKQRSF